jgi:hypothetical protein
MDGDRDYYALYNQGDAVVPCLVDALDDDTPIADPSEGPKIQDFQVGDLALLMLMHLEKVEYAAGMTRLASRERGEEETCATAATPLACGPTAPEPGQHRIAP